MRDRKQSRGGGGRKEPLGDYTGTFGRPATNDRKRLCKKDKTMRGV